MSQRYGNRSRANKKRGSMFLPKANPCGYRVDISDPEAAEKYKQYKLKHGIAYNDPMSHRERLDFESLMFIEEYTRTEVEVIRNRR